MLTKLQRTSLIVLVLVLLYWARIFRQWSTVEEAQDQLLPYIAFALGVGVLLSAFTWEKPKRSVFLISASVPFLAIVMNLLLSFLITEAKAGDMKGLIHDDSPLWVMIAILILVPVLIAVLHGLTALAGFYSSLWLQKQISARVLQRASPTEFLTESNVKLMTSVVGLLVAIIGALVGKQ